MPRADPDGADRQRQTIVRRLLDLAWAYRRRCLVVLGVQVLLLALGLAGLGLSGVAIDVLRHALDATAPSPSWPFGITPPAAWTPMQLVWLAGGLVLAMALVRAALSYFYATSLGHLVQMEVVPALRAAVYDKLQQMSFRFFDATASGSIINRVTGDVQAVRSFVDQVLIQSVVVVLALAVSLGYMLHKHAALTIACLAPSPLLWLATRTFSRRVQPAYEESRQQLDGLVTMLAETVQGMSVVKGFAREDERRALFDGRNDALYEHQRGIFRRVSRFTPAIDFLSQSSQLVLLGYGGMLVVRGQLTLGDVVVFAGLLQQYGAQVGNLANIVNTFQQSLISARRVFEVLDAKVEISSPIDPTLQGVRGPRVDGSVKFDGVTFGYRPGEQALVDVSFELRAGGKLVLFGETGSGKSSLLALVPRFYDPSAGRVLVGGRDVRRFDLADLRRQIGVVFQESFLFSATVAENIAFGQPDATPEAIERAARLAGAHEFVLRLPDGYRTVLEEGGANLSGGQRQRLALARAVLRDPPILLLDDPTAAVDPETEAEVMAALAKAASERTTLLATHRLSACRDADLILVLENGRVVERGTHDELIAAAGRYRDAALLHAAGEDAALAAGGAS
jgi:ATP-binding cassette subfamily B protein